MARKKSEAKPPPAIFDNVTIFIVPLGDLKGAVRRQVLERRIVEHGGTVVFDPAEAAIIITSPSVPPEVLVKAVGTPSGCLVDVQWVSECLTRSERLDTAPYAITCPQVASKSSVRDASAEETKGTESEAKEQGGSVINEHLARIFDHLESMVASSRDRRDAFRSMAYRRAASAIRKHRTPIRSDEDADELRAQIGPKSVEKVKEFLHTGKVAKAEYLQDDSAVKARTALMGIYGVGPAVASELINKGFDSIEKLRKSGTDLLNTNQKIGLEFYEELLPKMPRSEVAEIANVVGESVKKLFGDQLEMVVCGSYHRGAEFCSDADFLFSWKRDASIHLSVEDTLKRITDDLTAGGFLIDHFNKQNHHTVFLGICRLGEGRSARRIDMKVWPRDSMACAVLHFTGNADFNRRLRLFAKRKGFRLNDLGLTNSAGNVLMYETEEAVFHALGLEYISPENRTSSAQLRTVSGETASMGDLATTETDVSDVELEAA